MSDQNKNNQEFHSGKMANGSIYSSGFLYQHESFTQWITSEDHSHLIADSVWVVPACIEYLTYLLHDFNLQGAL